MAEWRKGGGGVVSLGFQPKMPAAEYQWPDNLQLHFTTLVQRYWSDTTFVVICQLENYIDRCTKGSLV